MAFIDTALSNLNANYSNIVSLIPNKYNFTDEPTTSSTSILDGGNDMYDTANVMNTNRTHAYSTVRLNGFSTRLTTSIPYVHTKHTNTSFVYKGDGVVTDGTTAFGTGAKYVTNLYPGLFVMMAADISITEFSVTGNIGIDGGGTLTTDDFTLTVDDNQYAIYRKSISGSTDPSINHIFIIPGAGTGVTHTWDTSRSYDDDAIQNLTGVTHLYYLLPARASGALLSHNDAVSIITAFIETIGGVYSPPAGDQTITATSISTSEAFGTQMLKRSVIATSITSVESLSSNFVKNTLNSSSGLASAESVSSNVVKLTIIATSLESNAFSDNKINLSISVSSIAHEESVENPSVSFPRVLLTLMPVSTSTLEGVSSNHVKLTIESTSIFDEAFGINQVKLNIFSNSISSNEFVSNNQIKLTISSSSISSQEIIIPEDMMIKFILLVSSSGLTSGEYVGEHQVGKNFFLLPTYFCPNDTIDFNCRRKGAALLPAITVLRQNIYVKNQVPIQDRPRQGFYGKYSIEE